MLIDKRFYNECVFAYKTKDIKYITFLLSKLEEKNKTLAEEKKKFDSTVEDLKKEKKDYTKESFNSIIYGLRNANYYYLFSSIYKDTKRLAQLQEMLRGGKYGSKGIR